MKIVQKHNFNSLVAKLDLWEITPEDLDNLYSEWSDIPEKDSKEYNKKQLLVELGEIKCVSENGGDGDGSTMTNVYHFVQQNIFVKIIGIYRSYSDSYWDDDFIEVKPKIIKRLEFHAPGTEIEDETIKF